MSLFDRWRRRTHDDDATQRWVVIDCETSGLDTERDELLAVAGVALRCEGDDVAVLPSDSFEILVRPEHVSDHDNILVHGIGRGAQRDGRPPAEAMAALAAWVNESPLIAFHAPFDRSFIERTCKRHGQQTPSRQWLDIAQLVLALYPQRKLRGLDDWLKLFDLAAQSRHSAASDALATALLMTCLLPEAARQGARTFTALQRCAQSARWTGA